MIPISILDLAPIREGHDAADALASAVALAQTAERAGYRRYWMAEHHNMPGVASSATAVALAHVGAHTRTIRIGSGGVMLPNHAPLVVAEQFGTLAALHPGRIDLGLGRAPGGDMATTVALRRGKDPDRFPDDVAELLAYLGPANPAAPVRAIPGEGSEVPIWILGSSLYGAQVAAHFGLPYAFASHFAPDALDQAAAVYRQRFEPSAWLDRPHFMMAANVYAADTDEEAARLRSSHQLAFANLRLGRPGPLPRPVDDIAAHLSAEALAAVNHALRVTACGAPEKAGAELAEMIERHRPDELILAGAAHDQAARLRSFELVAAEMARRAPAQAAE